ncbi:MAG: response regulator [Streptosporangiaceae bacterium]
MTRVLVVDDEPQILRALRINLRVRNYEVDTAATGSEALTAAGRHPPDLVLLDLGLPDLDGVEVIEGLRGWTEAPIIVLSGRADSTDKVEALDAGADDYVTKPFGMEELLARMRAALRRSGPAAAEPVARLGDVVIDLAAKTVTRAGDGSGGGAVPGAGAASGGAGGRDAGAGAEGGSGDGDDAGSRDGSGDGDGDGSGGGAAPGAGAIRLTPTEWHLLEVLLRNPGKLLTQRQLLTEVWGPGYADASGNLRLYMAQLRRKLEPDPGRPRWLLTEPGMGYRYQPGGDAGAGGGTAADGSAVG